MTVSRISRRGLAWGLGAPLMLAGSAVAAAPLLDKALAPLARFAGTWRGEGEGEPGVSRVERTCEPALGGKFLMARNTSRYAPQPKNPKGEVHEDLGFYSYDRATKAFVFRQFHIEGFVNQYAAPATSLAGDVWVFESVSFENIPAGFKARETYSFSGPDAFEERFEIAEPGQSFTTYSLNRLRRV